MQFLIPRYGGYQQVYEQQYRPGQVCQSNRYENAPGQPFCQDRFGCMSALLGHIVSAEPKTISQKARANFLLQELLASCTFCQDRFSYNQPSPRFYANCRPPTVPEPVQCRPVAGYDPYAQPGCLGSRCAGCAVSLSSK